MISIVVNRKKTEANKFSDVLERKLKHLKMDFHVIKNFPFSKKECSLLKKSDLLVALGGDGTTLNAFKTLDGDFSKIIISINFGTLGYIGNVSQKKALSFLEKYANFLNELRDHQAVIAKLQTSKNKQWITEKKRLLYAKALTADKRMHCHYSLNEVVVCSSKPGKPIILQISLGNQELCQMLGDGALIATPTGSTAYNLSAGGPIVLGNIPVMIFNPINPHSLSLKPLVIDHKQVIKVTCLNQGELCVDGLSLLSLKKGESVELTLSEKSINFLQDKNFDHYKILKEKLNWGLHRGRKNNRKT